MQQKYHWFLITYVCDDRYNSWINNTHRSIYAKSPRPYLTRGEISNFQPSSDHTPLSVSCLGEMTEVEFNGE